MKRTCLSFCLFALLATACLPAQTDHSSAAQAASPAPAHVKAKKELVEMKPFSRVALSGGISVMGINLQAATNVNRYLNVRGVGNVFQYTANNITTGSSNGATGFNVNANLNFATAGVMLDYYPFPRHGFRISPGVMVYNQNQISATGVAAPGASISLDGNKYYSSTSGANPITMNAQLGLNNYQQAFMFTTGWGNMIPRSGGHWSFPFEVGVVYVGSPTVNMTVGGDGCDSTGTTCVPIDTLAGFQSDLNAQIAKYQNDVNVLKVYPILSFGVAYNFKIR